MSLITPLWVVKEMAAQWERHVHLWGGLLHRASILELCKTLRAGKPPNIGRRLRID